MISFDAISQVGQELYGDAWKNHIHIDLNVSPRLINKMQEAGIVPYYIQLRLRKIMEQRQNKVVVDHKVVQETDEEIATRINKRFSIMRRMVDGTIDQTIRSMIVSGAAGVGKTYDIDSILRKYEKSGQLKHYDLIKGAVSPPGLYVALFHAKDGGVIVVDDSDNIFDDEQSFNILKGALDSSDVRTISWRKNSSWIYSDIKGDGIVDEDGRYPDRFDFKGSIIFITNLNFEEKIKQNSKMSIHFSALMSRSLYLDLTLHSNREKLIRIKDVFFNSIAKKEQLNDVDANEIYEYLIANSDRMMELSLRTIKHVAGLRKLGDDWKEIVEVTLFKKSK